MSTDRQTAVVAVQYLHLRKVRVVHLRQARQSESVVRVARLENDGRIRWVELQAIRPSQRGAAVERRTGRSGDDAAREIDTRDV